MVCQKEVLPSKDGHAVPCQIFYLEISCSLQSV